MVNLITKLAQKAPEEGTYIVTIEFYDEESELVTPNEAVWTLTDERGNVINGRQNVEITPLASSATIVLFGDDLKIGTSGVNRCLLVEGTYDSTLGDDLPLKGQLNFEIANFIAVT